MPILNYIIWSLCLLITLTWCIGSFIKPKAMGGTQSWGTTNFKMAIMFFISLTFVFILNLSPLNLIILFPASILISGSVSTRELVEYALKNNRKPEEVFMIDLKDTSGLIRSIVYLSIILIILYLINFNFFW